MPEFIATLAIFALAALGLAAGMLLGGRGLRGGCHGAGEEPEGGCGQPGCCSSVPKRERPLVQLNAEPQKTSEGSDPK